MALGSKMRRPKNDGIQVLPGEDSIIHSTDVLTGQIIEKAKIKGKIIEKNRGVETPCTCIRSRQGHKQERHSKCHKTQSCAFT